MIGGDRSLAGLRVEALSRRSSAPIFPDPDFGVPQVSMLGAILLIFKSVYAEDSFCLVRSFDTGPVVGLFGLLLSVCITMIAYAVWTRSWGYGTGYTYTELWRLTVGKWCSWVPIVCLLLTYVINIVACDQEIAYWVGNLVWTLWLDAPTAVTNFYVLSYVFLFVVALPCLFFPRVTWFTWISALVLFFSIAAIICLIALLFATQWDSKYSACAPVTANQWTFVNVYSFVTTYTSALVGQPMLSAIVRDMTFPSRSRIMRSVFVANCIAGAFLYLIPFLGWLLCTDVPQYDSVFNYVDPYIPYVIAIKVAQVLSALFSCAYYMHFIAKEIVAHLADKAEFQRSSTWCAGMVIGLIAIAVNAMGQPWLSLAYALAYPAKCLVAYILPGVFYLRQYGTANRKWTFLATVTMAIGLGLIVISIIGRIQTGLAS
jgi:hypothetical protein